MVQISPASRTRAALGESPVWDSRSGTLWWVDIAAGIVHSLHPGSGRENGWPVGEAVGCLALRAAGGLVIATASGFRFFDPATGATRHIADPEAHLPGNRFNDGATDPAGRFWAGTMTGDGAPGASVWRLDPDLTVTCWRGGYRTTNGLAFSPDGRTLYVSDSHPEVRQIWQADYDPATGTAGPPRPFFDTRAVAGRPDGGAVDAEGCYWQAGVSGWELYRLSPAGALLMTVPLPVERPTKVAFGGPDLDVLYVTTIAAQKPGGDDRQPLAGRVLAVTGLGIRGLPAVPFAG